MSTKIAPIAGGVALAALCAAVTPALAKETVSYPSAEVCASCHVETYNSWSRTFHALATIDPVFDEALDRAEKKWGRKTRILCLTCHSPMTTLTGDYDLATPLSREGVTCPFCHSVTAIDRTLMSDRFTNEPERLVFGSDAVHPDDHHFENHRITMSSEFCAGCHEWSNEHGLKVLTTYSEWRESFYAGENVTCQQCHMPKSMGNAVMVDGKKIFRSSNLHFQRGGHSQDQLVVAAKMSVEPLIDESSIIADVDLTNFKAGHKLPTGIPTRKMKLVAELYDRKGLLLDTRERVYSRIIADADGNILDDVTDQFVRGVREVSDNRLEPKETRRESFTFDRPPGEEFFLLEVSLEYEILTPYLTPPVLNFDVIKKRLPLTLVEKEENSVLPALAIIAILFLFVTAIMGTILRKSSAQRDAGARKE